MKIRFTILLLFLASCSILSAQTSGFAFLGGQTNNAGILVRFNPVSPSAQADSTLTNGAGAYSINLAPGVYEVDFSKAGFQTLFYQNGASFLFAGADTLDPVTLPPGLFKFVNGNLAGNLDADTTYIATGDLFVPLGQTLDIEAGTQVLFNGNYKLEVEGRLNAIGTPAAPITFARNPLAQIPQWLGIIETDVDTAIFRYCLVDHSEKGIEITSVRPGNPTWLEVTNSTVRYNAFHGVITSGDVNAEISENEFYGIIAAGVYSATFANSSSSITCNVVHNGTTIGISVFNSAGDLYIAGNYIHDISTYLGGNFSYGIKMNHYGGDILAENNLIVNVREGLFESSSQTGLPPAILQNNVVYNAETGIIFSGNGGAIARMNLISDCDNGYLQYSNTFGTPNTFSYNAFFNIQQSYTAPGLTGLGTLVTTNANGDSTDAYFNLTADPLFNPPFNYYPQAGSALINAGDPSAPLDTNGTVADIGLRRDFLSCLNIPELNPRVNTSISDRDLLSMQVTVYPNPANSRFRIDAPADIVSVRIFDLNGRLVQAEGNELQSIEPGEYSVEGLEEGLYFLEITTQEGTAYKRLLLQP